MFITLNIKYKKNNIYALQNFYLSLNLLHTDTVIPVPISSTLSQFSMELPPCRTFEEMFPFVVGLKTFFQELSLHHDLGAFYGQRSAIATGSIAEEALYSFMAESLQVTTKTQQQAASSAE